MIRDPDFAEDLVQDIFLKAFKSLKNYKNDHAFSTWLYRIARNHTIDYLRKKKIETLSIHVDDHDQTRSICRAVGAIGFMHNDVHLKQYQALSTSGI